MSIRVRAPHIETIALAEVRTQITGVIQPLLPDATVQINLAGEESQTGLGKRLGASGRTSSFDQLGSLLPSTPNGSGRQHRHPTNIGAWLARAAARELIANGRGLAIQVRVYWHPLDVRPSHLVIRNERGEDLSSLLPLDRFDLSMAPASWLRPELLVESLRAPFTTGIVLPWEHGI